MTNGGKSLELVTATANPDKVREIQAILEASQAKAKIMLLPRPASIPVPEEDADTLLGNARIKAQCIAEATGQPAVADDTGLEVAALDGAPGVHSARFAGPQASYHDNVTALLEALAGVPAANRQAQFRTVALVRFPDGHEVFAEGTVAGSIGTQPQGEGGFGYDPVFIPDEADGLTLAELSADEKNSLSARGRAFRSLVQELASRQ